jgi:hypothetical protein
MSTLNDTPSEWKPGALFEQPSHLPGTPATDYERCRDNPRLRPVRDRLEDTWRRLGYLCPETETQFRQDFRAQFHQRAWELYLLAAFDGAGMALNRPTRAAPDLCVRLADGGTCWVEATAKPHGADPTLFRFPSPMPTSFGYHLNDTAMILRYASAFQDKRSKVAGYRAGGVVRPEDTVIIAIYTGEIDCADQYDVFSPTLAKVLFPFGDPQLHVPIETSTEEVTQHWAHKPDVPKYNGAVVDTFAFMNPENAFVSAVMYANTSILRLSWNPAEALGMIHNHLATVPLPKVILPLRCEMWVAEGELKHRGRCADVGVYST